MIYIVLGTKAQLIKMAPIMVRLRDNNIPYNFIHTGQHHDTMEEMLHDFGLKSPDLVLYNGPDIVTVFQMVVWAVKLLLKSLALKGTVFGDDTNGIVLVHGDTLSTFLGALMGRLAGLRVGHVESGLRSFNLFHPFPEEITRLLVFRLSHVLYCPGQGPIDNVASLKKEKINTFANTMADIVEMTLQKRRRQDHVPDCAYALVSLHRYENIFNKERFKLIISLLEEISKKQYLLFILHPPTEKQLDKMGFLNQIVRNPNIECRPRYHHSDFISLMEKSEFIITDGGSLQEEAAYMGVPCLLMRKATERQEGLGQNVVLSKYDERIIDSFVHNYREKRREKLRIIKSPSDIIIKSAMRY